jgi:hypothetical protein
LREVGLVAVSNLMPPLYEFVLDKVLMLHEPTSIDIERIKANGETIII